MSAKFSSSLFVTPQVFLQIVIVQKRSSAAGGGDGTIMEIPVEIKTAIQGSSASAAFQHELGEVPWKGPTYMIFCIYFTGLYIYDVVFISFL